jgi:hypothetical protein
MPASLPPPPPPPPPGDGARVAELVAGYFFLPLVVGMIYRVLPMPDGDVARSIARGAIFLAIPADFAVLIFGLTQATWAAWGCWLIELCLLGMLGIASVMLGGAWVPLLVMGAAMAFLAARTRTLDRIRQAASRSRSAA